MQGLNVLTALAVFVLVTRTVNASEFAGYAAVTAAYAVANAVLGTAVGIAGMSDVASRRSSRILLSRAWMLGGLAAAAVLVVAVGLIVRLDAVNIVAACVGVLPWIASEIVNGYVLGQQRLGQYVGLNFGRAIVWVGTCAIGLAMTSGKWHLTVAFVSLGLSAAVPILFGLSHGVIGSRRVPRTSGVSIGALGAAQLSLWVIASGDRVIFARVDITHAALYAALYGVLDRVYRTLANAELFRSLPRLFTANAEMEQVRIVVPGLSVIAMSVAGALSAPAVVAGLSGNRYHPGYTLSALLTIAMVLMLLATPLYGAGIARGATPHLAVIAGVIASANLGLNVVLIPRFGAVGAAGVTLFSYGVWYIALVVLCGRRRPVGSAKRRSPGVEAMNSLRSAER